MARPASPSETTAQLGCLGQAAAVALLVLAVATRERPAISIGAGACSLALLAVTEVIRRRRLAATPVPAGWLADDEPPPLTPRTTTRPTRDGVVALLLALGFAAGAANTGTNLLLLVASVVGVAAAGNAVFARLLVGRVRARVRLPATGTQGEPLDVTLELEAARAVDAPVTVTIDAPGQLEPAPSALALALAVGAPATATVSARPLRRGWLEVAAARVVTRAPFGLARAERRAPLEAPARALIVPAVRIVRPDLLRGPEVEGEAASTRRWSALEARDTVRGVREWRPGDDRRALHPRASARHGALLVREHERLAPRRALVVLHLEPAGRGGVVDADAATAAARADAACTLAASLVAALAAERRPEGPTEVALAVSGEGAPSVIGPGVGPALLERARAALALAAPRPAGAPIDAPGLERALARAARGARALLVTTADDPALLRDVPALGRARVIVVPREPEARAALFAAPDAALEGPA